MWDCDVLQESGLGTCHLCWGGLPGDAGAFELPLLFVSNPSPLLLFITSIKMHWFPNLGIGATTTRLRTEFSSHLPNSFFYKVSVHQLYTSLACVLLVLALLFLCICEYAFLGFSPPFCFVVLCLRQGFSLSCSLNQLARLDNKPQGSLQFLPPEH